MKLLFILGNGSDILYTLAQRRFSMIKSIFPFVVRCRSAKKCPHCSENFIKSGKTFPQIEVKDIFEFILGATGKSK